MNIWSQYISEINYFWMLAVLVLNCTRELSGRETSKGRGKKKKRNYVHKCWQGILNHLTVLPSLKLHSDWTFATAYMASVATQWSEVTLPPHHDHSTITVSERKHGDCTTVVSYSVMRHKYKHKSGEYNWIIDLTWSCSIHLLWWCYQRLEVPWEESNITWEQGLGTW